MRAQTYTLSIASAQARTGHTPPSGDLYRGDAHKALHPSPPHALIASPSCQHILAKCRYRRRPPSPGRAALHCLMHTMCTSPSQVGCTYVAAHPPGGQGNHWWASRRACRWRPAWCTPAQSRTCAVAQKHALMSFMLQPADVHTPHAVASTALASLPLFLSSTMPQYQARPGSAPGSACGPSHAQGSGKGGPGALQQAAAAPDRACHAQRARAHGSDAPSVQQGTGSRAWQGCTHQQSCSRALGVSCSRSLARVLLGWGMPAGTCSAKRAG